ncbi:MAG: hypothetical protein IIW36_03655 [Clostridia bacterium]|jgi:energy-converting hydrogenase Eha subunit F|nr:hypothetical protein [Clostridia bacterium]
MKKNVVGHMMAPKETARNRFRRWGVLPRLFCLLLAMVLWLLIFNAKESHKELPPEDATATAGALV